MSTHSRKETIPQNYSMHPWGDLRKKENKGQVWKPPGLFFRTMKKGNGVLTRLINNAAWPFITAVVAHLNCHQVTKTLTQTTTKRGFLSTTSEASTSTNSLSGMGLLK